MSFSDRFREFRKSLKLTQEELAVKLKIDTPNISFYENGKTLPSVQTLEIISITYNLNVNWLLTGRGSMFLDEKPLEKVKRDKEVKQSDKEVENELLKKELSETQRALSEEKKKVSDLTQTTAIQYNTIQYQTDTIQKLDDVNKRLDDVNKRLVDWNKQLVERDKESDEDVITPTTPLKKLPKPT